MGLVGRPKFVGSRATRIEDERLLAAGGRYVADLELPDMLEMAIVRSPFAHAEIRSIAVAGALDSPGVVGAFTAADLGGVKPYPHFFELARPVLPFPLARGRVRYVGSPIAAVVAENRYVGEDACEEVHVEFEELQTVGTIEQALGSEAPRLYPDWPDNRILEVGERSQRVSEALARHRVITKTFHVQRHTGMPIETRGCVANFRDGRLTLWTTNQQPHMARTALTYVLPVSERDIRVVALDVGGGFGVKQHLYPEEILACWLTMKLGRPIRFIEDRAEHMVSTIHARDLTVEIEGAVADDGVVMGLRVSMYHDVGSAEAWLAASFTPSLVAAAHVTGPYKIELADVVVTAVVTNKTPSGSFRGYGAPEAVFAIERFVEIAAREVGASPLEVRRSMLLLPDDLPYTTAGGARLDSGSFREAFDRAIVLGKEGLSRARLTAGEWPVALGVGYATYLEGTTPTHFGASAHWTSQDSCAIRIEPDGTATVSVGVTTQGQGTESLVATVAADALGIPLQDIRVVMGDSDACPYGLGAWGSRSTVVATGAVLSAARRIREKVLRIAAHRLEVAVEDLVIEHGEIHVRGDPAHSLSMADIGHIANVRTFDLPADLDPGLDSIASYEPPGLQHWPDAAGHINACAAWANATHAAVVAVDVETGMIRVLEYIVVHDCGTVIHPVIVEGQIHGGVAQGIGGALYEDLPFDGSGQPLAASFMDYLVPTAAEIPPMTVEHLESPSPIMPLGVKGVGEGGTIGPPAAIANAVDSALSRFHVQLVSTPLTPPALLRAIKADAKEDPHRRQAPD
jgi:carbon-monoxide dehydrogenase large subunit